MHVVITGANRGIGQALDHRFRALGHDVTGTARNEAEFLKLDVTSPESQAEAARALDAKPIDLLVCNAGVYLDKGQNLADGFPADMWTQSFAANVTGVFLTVQSLLPNLQLSATPKIAIISSQMGSDTRAPGGSYIYRASKAAALNLGRNLATDLKHIGIAVGVYHPGWVKTDMGGPDGDITVTESAEGLANRFQALSLETTGCFETWDGRAHPY
ncbi:SDR family NAD(P)-dependent oxidoreductase [Shimia haliotis]|uniref:NAD(P)-dependent dehydrogenase, short-chain alcohol dehydrogenase family n=1 Tax=Shimia haliotis TaxID=1280847 RepID=A0A1I4A5L7_9RHOB|nr:SDR family NAD(P)-dependent oxidoreductase [Shimia haliotis]SFK51417.1 NAD(P)-dependent dehydrogenase, short-chain alcohol dehydrogenase family [Shimia haliotis]